MIKAVLQHGYGSAKSCISLDLIPKALSKPKSNEVVIQVHACSLNPLDTWVRNGYGRHLFETQRTLPFVIGRDCSGIVVDIGTNVWNFKVGDEVYAASSPLDTGCQAQFVALSEHSVSKKPKNLTHIESASIPYVGLTAYSALFDNAKVKRGQKVLVMGAAGGVGSFAVQLLKYLGCEVSGSCSTKNIERVKNMGADQVFDYTNPNQITNHDQKYDLILDCVGGDERISAFEKVKPGGSLVSVCGDLIRICDSQGIITGLTSAFVQYSSEKLVQKAGLDIDYQWAYFRASGQRLQKIAELMESCVIKAFVDERHFLLEDIVEVHEYYESGKANGKKIVMEVKQDPI